MTSVAMRGLPSNSSEEGFVSGSSASDSPSFVDRLAFDISNSLNLLATADTQGFVSVQKCSSDSGASSGDGCAFELLQNLQQEISSSDQNGLGELGVHHQLPGPWFFEEMGGSGQSSSPTDFDNDFTLSLRAALSTRNVTESVEVPSSEHVAEIVGRQGCKIKALRAKTNTYIKTPVRGEEPVFVVTGRAEDVVEARREIECAAEHFTQIRASRRHSQGGVPAPGHVTAYVRVPLRVVGLVVGPKGATIKRIQQDTHTYIITPSREREPIFEVTGLPQNVDAARREIEQHIYQRTGNMPITDPSASIASYDLQLAGSCARGSLSSYGALARRSSAIETSSAFAEFQRNGNDVSFSSGRGVISKQYSVVDEQYPAWSAAYSSLGITAEHTPHHYSDRALQASESPETSFSTDPYHLMMSSIWSDLENPRDPPVSTETPIAIA